MLTTGYEAIEKLWERIGDGPISWTSFVPKRRIEWRDEGEIRGQTIENYVADAVKKLAKGAGSGIRLYNNQTREGDFYSYAFDDRGRCDVLNGSPNPIGDLDLVFGLRNPALFDIRIAKYTDGSGDPKSYVKGAVDEKRIRNVRFWMNDLFSREDGYVGYHHALIVPRDVYDQHRGHPRSRLTTFAGRGGLVLPFPEEAISELNNEIKSLKDEALHGQGVASLAGA